MLNSRNNVGGGGGGGGGGGWILFHVLFDAGLEIPGFF